MGALLDAVPAGGADHTEHHRDLATAVEAVDVSGLQPLDSDLTAIAALTTTSYGRGLLTLANQAALQAEAGGSALVPGVDYPTSTTVTLSSADILDLHTTPITLVAAPGAGKFIAAQTFVSYFSAGVTEYLSAGDVVADWYWGTERMGTIIDLSGTSDSLKVVTGSGNIDPATATNAPIKAGCVDALTDGDGTLTVTCWYTVEDVPA